MNRSTLLFPVLFLAAGCGLTKSPETERSAQSEQSTVVILDSGMSQQALTTLSSCRSCHSEVASVSELVRAGWVVPGEPASSPLFLRLDEGTMPPEGPLAQSQIDLIGDWIQSGLAPAGS
jgi:hypothetical protein